MKTMSNCIWAPLKRTVLAPLMSEPWRELSEPLLDDRDDPVENEEGTDTNLSCHGVNYSVDMNTSIGSKACQLGQPERRQILFDVSCIFKNGMTAILGLTGSGKSTLLDILAGRQSQQAYQGTLNINGRPLPSPSAFGDMVGYVTQDDMLSEDLTVLENIRFAANLRLPQSMPLEERMGCVQKVIDQMELTGCADTLLGTLLQRGVSGGQRKRTCIAMELVRSPRILVLDEPTTGLDSAVALEVMRCLRSAAQQGCTIIFSIHQPRYSIFELFDHVLILANGRPVYSGPPANLALHFESQGYAFREQDTPADFALDVVHDAARPGVETMGKLHEAYYGSAMYNASRTIPIDCFFEPDLSMLPRPTRSFARDLFHVFERELRKSIRNLSAPVVQLTGGIVLGVFIGILFNEIPRTTDSGVDKRLKCIFFMTVSQIFSAATALESLIKQYPLIVHEINSGYYQIRTLFLSKLLCDILVMRVIPSLVFSVICYFLIGFQRTFVHFLVFLLTNFMVNVFGSALCFLIAAIVPVYANAVGALAVVVVIMMMFSGVIIDLAAVPGVLRWLKWVSGVRYACNVLMINEFRNLSLCLANNTNICPQSGNDVLEKKSIDHASSWDMWKYSFALVALTVLFYFFAFIRLSFMKRVK